MASVRDGFFPYMKILLSHENEAARLSSELSLEPEELVYLTGWDESRAEEVVGTNEPEEVDEKEDNDDDSQSTLSSF